MIAILEFIKLYGAQLSAIGAALAFAFAVYKFRVERETTLFWKEFEVYHKLVKEFVNPNTESGPTYDDQRAAILFEMRNFKRYYPYSLRMLKGLREKWKPKLHEPSRLLDELELTIAFIEKKL